MPRRSPTSLALLARGILAWAERQGIDRHHLLRASRLDERLLGGREARIPREAHVDLWRETERALKDPDFGLKSAESILSAASLGVVGMLAMTSATVGESIARSVRYGRILKEDVAAR